VERHRLEDSVGRRFCIAEIHAEMLVAAAARIGEGSAKFRLRIITNLCCCPSVRAIWCNYLAKTDFDSQQSVGMELCRFTKSIPGIHHYRITSIFSSRPFALKKFNFWKFSF